MIKNLLFDLGGVIMDIEKNRCVKAFDELGLKDASSYFGEYSQQGPFMALERGDIDADEFHHILRGGFDKPVTDGEIDRAFCQFLIGIPVKRLHQLEELRSKYKVYMLSNTNPIMWAATIRDEFRKDGREREDYFDGIVTSFEAKSLKPDKAIFDCVVSQLGVKPEETLFFDDSQANLDAAAALGFKTQLVAPGTEFYDAITDLGLI
ncbi:MAG: HAD family hydrolase [Muribaculaceae bacterium]